MGYACTARKPNFRVNFVNERNRVELGINCATCDRETIETIARKEQTNSVYDPSFGEKKNLYDLSLRSSSF